MQRLSIVVTYGSIALAPLLLLPTSQSRRPWPVPPILKNASQPSSRPCVTRKKPSEQFQTALSQHHLLASSAAKKRLYGQAVLGRHNLEDLTEECTDLSNQDLRSVMVVSTTARGANLRGADLHGAHLEWADLTGAHLEGADLSHAYLNNADLSDTHMEDAILGSAVLDGAVLLKTHLTRASLVLASLNGVDATGADLSQANMSESSLNDDTQFMEADLGSAIFETKLAPTVHAIASAKNLDLVTFDDEPISLNHLRQAVQDAGMRDLERDLTYAVMRRTEQRHKIDCSQKKDLVSCAAYVGEFVFFDWTFGFGRDPNHCILLIALNCWFFAFVYVIFLKLSRRSGLIRIRTRDSHHRSVQIRTRVRPSVIKAAGLKDKLSRWILGELRMIRIALFFSLTSALTFGFEQFDFGRWVRLLTKREYDLKGFGWVRTLSGVQALSGLLLLGLFIYASFGHPFSK
jgi:uncharacterized protein YjbI with pentapeptide repeats